MRWKRCGESHSADKVKTFGTTSQAGLPGDQDQAFCKLYHRKNCSLLRQLMGTVSIEQETDDPKLGSCGKLGMSQSLVHSCSQRAGPSAIWATTASWLLKKILSIVRLWLEWPSIMGNQKTWQDSTRLCAHSFPVFFWQNVSILYFVVHFCSSVGAARYFMSIEDILKILILHFTIYLARVRITICIAILMFLLINFNAIGINYLLSRWKPL